MPRKRPRKQLLLKLGVLLLLGAIVNVAVAWGASVLASTPNLVHTKLGADAQWPCPVPTSWPSPNERMLFTGWARTDDVYFRRNGFTLNVEAAGWPWKSLLSLNRHNNSPNWSYALGRDGKLPICPIWPGFAINTIFYAAMLWLLWIARRTPGKIRRFVRVRRGRCPACGFIIAPGTAAASGGPCSECGAAQQQKS